MTAFQMIIVSISNGIIMNECIFSVQNEQYMLDTTTIVSVLISDASPQKNKDSSTKREQPIPTSRHGSSQLLYSILINYHALFPKKCNTMLKNAPILQCCINLVIWNRPKLMAFIRGPRPIIHPSFEEICSVAFE